MQIFFGGDLIEVETAEFVAELNSFLRAHLPIAETVAICSNDQDRKVRTMLAELRKNNYMNVEAGLEIPNST